MLPVYCKDEANVEDGLYLGLFHGFKTEKERISTEGWGENGPLIGPLKWVQTTYGYTIKTQFVHEGDYEKYGFEKGVVHITLQARFGCIEFQGMKYGDWTVFNVKKETKDGVPDSKVS